MIPYLESANLLESMPFGIKTFPLVSLERQSPHSPERQAALVTIPALSRATRTVSSEEQGIVVTSFFPLFTLIINVFPTASLGKSGRRVGLRI